jgi:hypothetical protein
VTRGAELYPFYSSSERHLGSQLKWRPMLTPFDLLFWQWLAQQEFRAAQ